MRLRVIFESLNLQIQVQNRGLAAHTGPKGFKRNPLESCVFCCWKIEASQGRNGHVSAATVLVAKCRRLGGSRISGFEPLVSNRSFGVTSERDLLAFQPCRFSGRLGGSKAKLTETARFRCLKTALKNGAEQEVQDLRLESRSEGTA